MGQDPSTGDAAVTQEREPQDIRQDIEETREELGDTVAGLAEKTDVKAQAKHKVDDIKASVSEKKDEWVGKASEASPEGAASAAGAVTQKARENPLPVAMAGAFLAGLLVGRRRGQR